jgi:N-methylhydantoinase A/oxoprolinase/acetone carboxylase beta subunit
VLLAGYDALQVKSSGLVDLLGNEGIVCLGGGHDAGGIATHALDEAAARAAIAQHMGRVSAFAISATFGVRNPAHELQLRAWVQDMCDVPVTCGHELASSLGAPRRALTAALNARMIFHVKALIESVQRTLAARAIDAPLMVVQGDGSLINVASALRRPVNTVLSGPAASVLGACALSGLQNAVVADMGGTTTDIAVVRNGLPELSFDGALVGNWRPMVEAVKVYAVGLGGDSEVRLQGGEGLTIGPRRVVPISLLAHQHPHILAALERQQNETPHASQMRFAQRLHSDVALLARLNDDELYAWECLATGPVDMERTNLENRALARAIARLERKSLAIYSGFTPSDAAHVLGLSTHWSAAGATFAARIWARQMRHMYGLGTWKQGDAIGPAQDVVAKVVDTICQKLIEAGLNDAGQMNESSAGRVAALLTTMALAGGKTARAEVQIKAGEGVGTAASASAAAPTPVFQLQFSPTMPLVGVGAPAASYYPAVARGLGVALKLPQHAEVANAVGAVLGQVSQRLHITLTQPARGVFKVFTAQGPVDFGDLASAVAHAQQLAGAQARERALDAGADGVTVAFTQRNNSVNNDIDGNVFFEAVVTATASGPPKRKAQGQ